MKKRFAGIVYLFILTIMAFVMVSCKKEKKQETVQEVTVNEVAGTADVEHPNGEKETIRTGNALSEADVIYTGEDSSVFIDLTQGKQVQIGENTIFALSALQTDESGNVTILSLKQGSIVNIVDQALEEGDYYEVHTPRLVMSVRGTSNMMTTDSERDGVIAITGDTRTIVGNHVSRIVPGMQLELEEGATMPNLTPIASSELPLLAASFAKKRSIAFKSLSPEEIEKQQEDAADGVEKWLSDKNGISDSIGNASDDEAPLPVGENDATPTPDDVSSPLPTTTSESTDPSPIVQDTDLQYAKQTSAANNATSVNSKPKTSVKPKNTVKPKATAKPKANKVPSKKVNRTPTKTPAVKSTAKPSATIKPANSPTPISTPTPKPQPTTVATKEPVPIHSAEPTHTTKPPIPTHTWTPTPTATSEPTPTIKPTPAATPTINPTMEPSESPTPTEDPNKKHTVQFAVRAKTGSSYVDHILHTVTDVSTQLMYMIPYYRYNNTNNTNAYIPINIPSKITKDTTIYMELERMVNFYYSYNGKSELALSINSDEFFGLTWIKDANGSLFYYKPSLSDLKDLGLNDIPTGYVVAPWSDAELFERIYLLNPPFSYIIPLQPDDE